MKKIDLDGLTLILVAGDTAEISALPPHSVSLDGYVQGPVAGDSEDRWSLDHHADCVRLYTLATCEQVYAHLCLGGAGWFENRTIFVNDLDGDTLLSLWLINNPARVSEDLVRDLVRAVGTVDAQGPAGTLLLSKREQRLATLFFRSAIQPVGNLRGRVREVFDQWPALMDECFKGITDLVDGALDPIQEGKETLDIVKTTKINGHTFILGTSDGFGFSTLYEMGFDGGILFKDAADGTRTYTLAKRSDLVNISIRDMLSSLNAQEPGWGGGSSIGGSPRGEGGRSSTLSPSEVWSICTGE